MDLWFWTLIVGLCIAVYYLKRKRSYFEDLGIPYLAGWPVLGNMGPFIFGTQHISETITKIYNVNDEAKYIGTFAFMEPIIILRDPELIKDITIKNFDSFPDHKAFIEGTLDPICGNNMLNIAGDKWRESRALLSPAFTLTKMKEMFELMVESMDNLVKHLSDMKKGKWEMLNTKDLFSKLSIDDPTMTTQPRSALITHYADGGETFGVSGILLSDDGGGWLLSHGSLLAPAFLEKPRHDVRHFLEGELRRLEKEIVEVPRKVARSMRFRVRLEEGSRDADCSLRYVWRCGLLRKTFNELLFSWSFEKLAKLDKSLLSIFVLLKIDSGNSGVSGSEEGRQVLSNFFTTHVATSIPRPRCGVPVEIESAPFGTAAFLGSVSRGIVSNVIGERGCLVLADANAVPGCEGAPVFLMEDRADRQIGGMVVAVLTWCRGEWVDYTFAANLQPCLARVLGKDGRADTEMLLPDVLDRSVVVVKCGSGWGTGVIVDAATGTIVTCSHVVREAPGSRIRIALANSSPNIDDDDDNNNDGDKVWARLVYRTRDGQPYDVAVLRLEQRHKGLVALPLASKLPDKGTAVLAAGYPFFGAGLPSLSSGVVSRRTPSVLQTTCCVQSGASGGPVVDARTGEMLGLVVSNAVAAGTRENGYKSTLYPRFNMAVPALVLRQSLMEFVKSGDARCLESLSSNDPEVLETWNFYLSPRSKM